jgi:hypothetical protein
MSLNRAKEELAASMAHPFHIDLHTPGLVPVPPVPGSQGTIYSATHDTQEPSTWVSLDDMVPLKCTMTNGEAVYTVPDTVSHLKTVKAITDMPLVEVADAFRGKVRIAWTTDLAYALIEEATVNILDAETFPMSRHWMAAYFQYQLASEHQAAHELSIGNRPELTEFSDRLPRAYIGSPHPFFFSLINGGLNVSMNPDVRLRYTLVTNGMELLRAQLFENGEWVNQREIEEDWLVKVPIIPPPEILATCTINRHEEVSAYKCTDGPVTQYVTDVLELVTSNPAEPRQKIQEMFTSDLPTKALCCQAENVTAREFHIFCNYTADWRTSFGGTTPIEQIVVKNDTKKRIVDRTNSLIGEMSAREHFKASPRRKGYHASALCHQPFDHRQTGVILPALKTTIHVELSPADPVVRQRDVKRGRDADVPMLTNKRHNVEFSEFVGGVLPLKPQASEVEVAPENAPVAVGPTKSKFVLRVFQLVQRKITYTQTKGGYTPSIQ